MIKAASLLDNPTRFLLFTGKGGVGKTSLACAAAVELADRGKRILLVSTDPASNLDEVLETRLGSEPTPVGGVSNLAALNIDPEAAARAYRNRVVDPYRGILPEAAITSMEEQLSDSKADAAMKWPADIQPLRMLVDELERAGHGVIMTMGKGGVGKTTVAAAIAVELAHRGHRVHLSTTDPAAHVARAVRDGVANLSVSRIDPAVETQNYAQEVLAKAAPHLDAKGKALLEEDLRSPCTEEIAVFRAFAQKVAQGTDEYVAVEEYSKGLVKNCPCCGSTKIEQKLGAINVMASKKRGSGGPSCCGPRSGPGCCG